MESQQYGHQLELSWGLVFMHKRDQSDDSANHSPRNRLAHMHNGICQCGINSPLSWEGAASSWKVDHSAGLRRGLYSKIQYDAADRILHFLRKRRFLSVTLPDPSTLILYWCSGRTEIIFPVVFHWRLSGLWMVTVSPACNGHRLWVCLLYVSTILALRLGRISSRRCAAAIHSGCGL